MFTPASSRFGVGHSGILACGIERALRELANRNAAKPADITLLGERGHHMPARICCKFNAPMHGPRCFGLRRRAGVRSL